MGARVPVKALTAAELNRLTSPQTVQGGNLEAYRHIVYDTQTYAAAGTTSLLTYFQTTNADRTLSNMEQAGTFPDPKYFQLWNLTCDVLIAPAEVADPHVWADMSVILQGARPIFSLFISDKEYGPWPLTFLHGSGGVTGFGYSAADATAESREYANNSIFDGGYCLDGSIIIPPKVGFYATIRWGNPTALQGANALVRVNLDGVVSRRIL